MQILAPLLLSHELGGARICKLETAPSSQTRWACKMLTLRAHLVRDDGAFASSQITGPSPSRAGTVISMMSCGPAARPAAPLPRHISMADGECRISTQANWPLNSTSVGPLRRTKPSSKKTLFSMVYELERNFEILQKNKKHFRTKHSIKKMNLTKPN